MISGSQPLSTRLLLLGRNEVVIGRSADSSLRIEDAQVHGRLAAIQYRRGNYYLKGLKRKSATGTFLNDRAVRRSKRLRHGDNLRFGPVSYRFIDPDAWIRHRNRRIVRIVAAAAVLVAGVFAHLKDYDHGLIDLVREETAPPAPPRVIAKVQPPVATPIPASSTPLAPAATIAPSAATTAAEAWTAPWTARLNYYRDLAGVPLLAEDTALTASVDAHTQYLFANFADLIRAGSSLGDRAYNEDKTRAGYSADGADAAPNSQIAWGCGTACPAVLIDRWFAGPFHRVVMLAPYASRGGFSRSGDAQCWVSALRIPPAATARPYDRPVIFPPDGATISLEWLGIESPNPLSACPGYEAPTGLPITLQMGPVKRLEFTPPTLTENGKPVEKCTFDATTYTNQDRSAQEYARRELHDSGAIVIIPKVPLKPGASYAVSISANGTAYSWTFRVAN